MRGIHAGVWEEGDFASDFEVERLENDRVKVTVKGTYPGPNFSGRLVVTDKDDTLAFQTRRGGCVVREQSNYDFEVVDEFEGAFPLGVIIEWKNGPEQIPIPGE